jgi:hypothetical protein
MRRWPLRLALSIAIGLPTAACGLVLSLPDSTIVSPADASPDDVTAADASNAVDAGPSEASTCSAALETDPDHCGSCGRSCLGGTCESGRCVPTALSETFTANAIALDSDFVYWLEANGPGIRRVPKGGGTVELVASITGSKIAAIGTNGDEVFWSTHTPYDASLVGCPRAGCPDAGPRLVLSTYTLVALATAGDKLYAAGQATYESEAVWNVSTDGGSSEIIREAGAATLADSTDVLVRGTRSIEKGAPTANAPETYVGPYIGTPTGLAVLGATIAWTDSFEDGGGVTRWSTGALPLVANGADPSGVALDARYVYWVNRAGTPGQGSIVACPLEGCPPDGPIVVVAPLDFPNAIALDAAYLYFTTYGSTGVGAVWRAPKL